MAFLELVKQRYSCRSYQEKSVEQEKLDYVMECVRFAPSAVNKQPWRLVVSGNKVHFYLKPDKGFVSDSVGDMQKIDMGIAICHFCLAAAEKGMETKLEIADPGLETAAGKAYIATIDIVS